jgi:SAM-dependent methyltransferase
MDQRYELQTHEVEEDHWWYRGRRRVLNRVIDQLDLPVGARILDAGCGSGRNMVDMARHGEVTGIELSQASVAVARRRGVGEVLEGSVDALPFPDGHFDLVASLDVLEHLDDDRRALAEMRRVTGPGGQLLVTVPAYQWLWSSHDEVNHHRRRYTRATLLRAAGDSGWQATRTTYFNSLLLPAAVAMRVLERLRRPVGPPNSDLQRTPTWLNRALQQPLNAEACLVGRGTRIPAGLSLLAVFR